MSRTIQSLVLCAGVCVGPCVGAQPRPVFDPDFPRSTIPLVHGQQNAPIPSYDDVIRTEELTRMRMQGVDLSLLTSQTPELPDFDSTRSKSKRTDWEESPLASFTPISDGLTLGSDIRFEVGRSTSLRDGGIAGTHGTIASDSPEDQLPSLAQSEGEYDLYDLALSWEALSKGPVSVNLTSGFKAIDGNINKRVTTNGETTLQDAQRVAVLPVVGTGVEWSINDQFSIRGSAQTHPIDGASSIVDVQAATAYHINNSIDLSVGYSLIRSTFDIGSIGAELTQEGIFARLQISF